MNTNRFTLVLIASVIFGLIGYAGPARAELITAGLFALRTAENVDDTGWVISFRTAEVSEVEYFAGPKLLTLRKDFNQFNPIKITFRQDVRHADNFGLRLTLNEAIFNSTGVTWGGFRMDLQDFHGFGNLHKIGDDPTVPNWNEFVSATHTGFAHFHGDFGGNLSGKVFAPPFEDMDPDKDLNGQKLLVLGNGSFPSGTSSLWGGFGIHQIEEFEHFGRFGGRSFVLTETPVPEPGSLALLGVGILGLIFCCRRRRVQVQQTKNAI